MLGPFSSLLEREQRDENLVHKPVYEPEHKEPSGIYGFSSYSVDCSNRKTIRVYRKGELVCGTYQNIVALVLDISSSYI